MPPMPPIKSTAITPVPIGGVVGVTTTTTQTAPPPPTNVAPAPTPVTPPPAPAPPSNATKAAFTGREFNNAEGVFSTWRQNPTGGGHRLGWANTDGVAPEEYAPNQDYIDREKAAKLNEVQHYESNHGGIMPYALPPFFINDSNMAPVVVGSVNQHGNVIASDNAQYVHGGANLTNPVPSNPMAVANVIKHIDDFMGHIAHPKTTGVATQLNSNSVVTNTAPRQNPTGGGHIMQSVKRPSFFSWLVGKKIF